MPQTKDITALADYLRSIDALTTGPSPWPLPPSPALPSASPSASLETRRVDWGVLFPTTQWGSDSGGFPMSDRWSPQLPDDFLRDLVRALDEGPPYGSSGVGGNGEGEGGGDGEGWDRCAWYSPIHYHGNNWGIFIKERCVLRTALRIARYCDFRPAPQDIPLLGKALIRAATYIYFLHEHFHHKIECLGLRLEIATGAAAYVPYHRAVYQPLLGTDKVLEEALANADSFLRLRTKPYTASIPAPVLKATQQYLRARFPGDPPGYRKAADYLTERLFGAGLNLLQAQVSEARERPIRDHKQWAYAPHMTQSLFNVKSEIWVVLAPGGGPSILPIRP